MIERNEIAIADLLRHKTLGIVSHQPQEDEKSDEIWVRNENWSLYHVYLADCEWPAEDDEKANNFWKRLKELGYMNPDNLLPKEKRTFVESERTKEATHKYLHILDKLGEKGRKKAMDIAKVGDVMEAKDIDKYLDVLDNELDRIHALLRYQPYEKQGGDYDELVKIMKRFQVEILKFGKALK